MNLTKQQRHECYIEALERFENNKGDFICLCLDEILRRKYQIELNFSTLVESFPELLAHKPTDKKIGDAWWELNRPCEQTRISVLKSCIEQTKP